MTTAAQRLIALSKLPSGTAAAHLMARALSPGNAGQRLVAISGIAVGTAAAHLIAAVQLLPLPSTEIAVSASSTAIEIEISTDAIGLTDWSSQPAAAVAVIDAVASTAVVEPQATASGGTAVTSDVTQPDVASSITAIEATVTTVVAKPEASGGTAVSFTYRQASIAFDFGRTLPPINLTDLLYATDELAIVTLPNEKSDGMRLTTSGRMLIQNYTSPTYFQDDYVGSVRAFT